MQSRWRVLHDALMGDGGIVQSLAADVLSPLNPGDKIDGWIFISSTSALTSGSEYNYLAVNCLQAM